MPTKNAPFGASGLEQDVMDCGIAFFGYSAVFGLFKGDAYIGIKGVHKLVKAHVVAFFISVNDDVADAVGSAFKQFGIQAMKGKQGVEDVGDFVHVGYFLS